PQSTSPPCTRSSHRARAPWRPTDATTSTAGAWSIRRRRSPISTPRSSASRSARRSRPPRLPPLLPSRPPPPGCRSAAPPRSRRGRWGNPYESLAAQDLIRRDHDLEHDQHHDDEFQAQRALGVDHVGEHLGGLGDDGELARERVGALRELVFVL